MILGALVFGFTAQSFAQDVLYEAKLKREEVPDVIVEAVVTDFPGFVTEDFIRYR